MRSNAANKTREEDEQDLEMLALIDIDGLSREAAGRAVGRSRNSVIGYYHRIREAMKDDNGTGNGTMPPRWWQT